MIEDTGYVTVGSKVELTAAETEDFKHTLETFKKAWGYAIPESLLERRALQAVIDRRRIKQK